MHSFRIFYTILSGFFFKFVFLKSRSHIFLSLILLLAMVLTVTRYISLPSDSIDKTELTKKTSAEEDEKDGEEDEAADDTDDMLNKFFDFEWSTYNIETELYDYNNQKYLSFTPRTTTPPPKI